jgi:hypothetical protein
MPKGKTTILTETIPVEAASALVRADGSLVGYGRHLSAMGQRYSWPAAKRLGSSAAVPVTATGSSWRTGFGLFNPGNDEVAVRIDLDGGAPVDMTLGPKAEKFHWLGAAEDATQITASGNIAVMEVFESLASGGDMAAVLLETRYLSSLYLPTIFNGPGESTSASIVNGHRDSTVRSLGFKADGETEEITLGPLGAHERMTIDLSEIFAGDTVSAGIVGEIGPPTPFGTPRALLQGLVGYGTESTTKLGAVKLNALKFKEGYLAVVPSDSESTYALMNPSEEDATVTVTARQGDGTSVAGTTLEIPAGASVTGPVTDLIGNLAVTGGTHVQLESNVDIYGLEILYAGGRMEVLPVLVAE